MRHGETRPYFLQKAEWKLLGLTVEPVVFIDLISSCKLRVSEPGGSVSTIFRSLRRMERWVCESFDFWLDETLLLLLLLAWLLLLLKSICLSSLLPFRPLAFSSLSSSSLMFDFVSLDLRQKLESSSKSVNSES